MSYPNSALAAWQLALIAVVPLAVLIVWITAIYLADRNPRWRYRQAADSPGETSQAGTSAPAEREPAGAAPKAASSGERHAA
jgi:hypothetical protein